MTRATPLVRHTPTSHTHDHDRASAIGRHLVTHEQDSKSRSNVIASSQSFASTVWQCASTAATTLTSLGLRALVAASLDKPTTVSAVTRVQTRTLTDLPQSSGLDQSVMLATSPPHAMPSIPELTSEHDDEMSLAALSMTPSLLQSFVFSPANLVGDTIARFPVNPKWLPLDYTGVTVGNPYPPIVRPTVLSKAAVPFSYWRGTLRYKFYFFCTSFHTARVAITYVPLQVLNVDGSGTSTGPLPTTDSMTRFVDIAGDTEVDVDVPFSFPNLYARHATGSLWVTVVNPIAELSAPAPCPIYCSVYVASGSDIVYKQLSNEMLIPCVTFSTAINEALVPHSNPRADFATAFDPIYSRSMTNTVTDPSFHDSYASVSDVVHQPVLVASNLGCRSQGGFSMTSTPTTRHTYSLSPARVTVNYTIQSSTDASAAINAVVWTFPIALDTTSGSGSSELAVPSGNFYIPPSIHFADVYKFQRGGYRVKMLCSSPLDIALYRTPEDLLWPRTQGANTYATNYEYYGPFSLARNYTDILAPSAPDGAVGPTTTLLQLDSTSEFEVPMSTHALFRTTGDPVVKRASGGPLLNMPLPPDSTADWISIANPGGFGGVDPPITRLYSALSDGFRFHYIKGPKASYRVRGSCPYGPALGPSGVPYPDSEATCPYF